MSDLDELFRRLSARGYFEITPSSRQVPAGAETDAEGRVRETWRTEAAVRLQWAPRGQGSPGGDNRFNSFCSRAWTGRTVAEVLRRAVEDTAPPWRPLGADAPRMSAKGSEAA